jgi:hypothetical protein
MGTMWIVIIVSVTLVPIGLLIAMFVLTWRKEYESEQDKTRHGFEVNLKERD